MFKDNILIEESEPLINSNKLTAKEETKSIFKINEINIDHSKSKMINRNKGKYITILWEKSDISSCVEDLIEIISNKIKELTETLKIDKNKKILFCGLGNKEITTDKFGYLVIEKLVAGNKLYKIYKDVEGLTNINSVKFIKAISDMLEVDLVVIIDSLKATHIERIGTTIQISTGGLYPGSALNEVSKEISKKTLKKDVICIGIPTIINMKEVKKENPDLLISKINIDHYVDDLSSIISIALNRMF